MRPDPAESGSVALRLMQQALAAGNPYRLVLLDAEMPEMDGYATAQRIRDDLKPSDSIIMMLSTCDLPKDSSRCRDLGIARYLVKPVMPSELLQAVLASLGHNPPKPLLETAPSQSGPDVLAGRRILVAEDHPVNRKLITKLLEKRSLVPVLAKNGEEVLLALDGGTFDLILMDVQMPGMDGLQTTAAIRERERASGGHVPILAMTAHALNRDREKCLAVGMDAYIAKPVSAAALYLAIAELLVGPTARV
jgi:CheY-like chemotaxis protein